MDPSTFLEASNIVRANMKTATELMTSIKARSMIVGEESVDSIHSQAIAKMIHDTNAVLDTILESWLEDKINSGPSPDIEVLQSILTGRACDQHNR